jgi:hypothetical protein
VFAVGRQQHEELAVAQILQAGVAPLASPAPSPLRDGDPVALDQLPVDGRRVLLRRDATLDVEVISAPHVAHGQLLHESRHRGGDAPVTHVHASTGCYGGVKVGSCIGGATFPKAQTLQHLAVLKTTSNLVVLKTSCSRCAQVSRPAPLSEAVFLHRSCAIHSGCAHKSLIPLRSRKSFSCSVAFDHRRLSPGHAGSNECSLDGELAGGGSDPTDLGPHFETG